MHRSRLILISAVALLALGLAACGGSSTTTTATETVTETQTTTQQDTEQGQTTANAGGNVYTEDSTTIDVATGDSFTIELPINPSTGYTWVPSVPMGYVQVSNEILPTDGDAMGQSTVERWVFSADTEGTASITFDLMPPGEGRASEQTVEFTVNAS